MIYLRAHWPASLAKQKPSQRIKWTIIEENAQFLNSGLTNTYTLTQRHTQTQQHTSRLAWDRFSGWLSRLVPDKDSDESAVELFIPFTTSKWRSHFFPVQMGACHTATVVLGATGKLQSRELSRAYKSHTPLIYRSLDRAPSVGHDWYCTEPSVYVITCLSYEIDVWALLS